MERARERDRHGERRLGRLDWSATFFHEASRTSRSLCSVPSPSGLLLLLPLSLLSFHFTSLPWICHHRTQQAFSARYIVFRNYSLFYFRCFPLRNRLLESREIYSHDEWIRCVWFHFQTLCCSSCLLYWIVRNESSDFIQWPKYGLYTQSVLVTE